MSGWEFATYDMPLTLLTLRGLLLQKKIQKFILSFPNRLDNLATKHIRALVVQDTHLNMKS